MYLIFLVYDILNVIVKNTYGRENFKELFYSYVENCHDQCGTRFLEKCLNKNRADD